MKKLWLTSEMSLLLDFATRSVKSSEHLDSLNKLSMWSGDFQAPVSMICYARPLNSASQLLMAEETYAICTTALIARSPVSPKMNLTSSSTKQSKLIKIYTLSPAIHSLSTSTKSLPTWKPRTTSPYAKINLPLLTTGKDSRWPALMKKVFTLRAASSRVKVLLKEHSLSVKIATALGLWRRVSSLLTCRRIRSVK